MASRASTIKDAIKSYDGSYQYRIYEELYKYAVDHNRFNLEGAQGAEAKELLESIDKYIDLQKDKSIYEQNLGYNLAWDNYMLKIEQQDTDRALDHRLVPLMASVGFSYSGDVQAELDAIKALYEIGGLCYYGDKAQ